MPQLFTNNARALLASGITDTATSLTVEAAKADLFPTANTGTGSVPAATNWFKVTLQDATGNVEIVYVRSRTAGSGVMSNIIRGQEGTTARAFSAGTVVGLRITALDVENSIAAASNSVQLTGDQTVAGVKTFSNGVTLASGQLLQWGAGLMGHFHNGTNGYLDLTAGNYIIRDNATNRFVFDRVTGNFTATGTVTGTNLVYNSGDQSIAGVKTFTAGYTSFAGINGAYNGTIYIGGASRHLRSVTASNAWEMVNATNTAVIHTFADNGDFTAAGNVTAYSDIRLKTDLAKIADALAKVNQLNGYTYTRIDTGERHAGVVAQEVREVLPEVVHEHDDGMLSVAYGNMVGLLIEAVKELTARVEKLEAR